MQLTDFCAQAQEVLARKPSVIILQSKQYSPLSFNHILRWLSKLTSDNHMMSSLQKLDLDGDLDQIKMKLHTTFLGESCNFWFGDLSLVTSKKKRTDWLTFLQNYQGPHQIIGWLCEDDIFNQSKNNNLKITVEEKYASDGLHKLVFLYQDHKPEISASFFGRLYRLKKEFSLEELCLLQSYIGCIGKNIDLFFQQWIEQLISSDLSLFQLAQLFFEKRADQFFILWHQIRNKYSDQFWTVFFSDQLFKAYFYVAVQGRVALDQKQITYGLPFSFLKNDWKFYTLATLSQAHASLYTIDLELKLGANSHQIDLFLIKFFAGR